MKRVNKRNVEDRFLEEVSENTIFIYKENQVSTPVHLGLSTLIVNLILPYVVQKPRRRRKAISYEEEEF